jgi:hypothetical protein
VPFPIFWPARARTFEARMQRARNEGYASRAREMKLFKIAMGNVTFEREQALDWLNTAIYEGRAELQSQHALEREVGAWDTSCRIAFLVANNACREVFPDFGCSGARITRVDAQGSSFPRRMYPSRCQAGNSELSQCQGLSLSFPSCILPEYTRYY